MCISIFIMGALLGYLLGYVSGFEICHRERVIPMNRMVDRMHKKLEELRKQKIE